MTCRMAEGIEAALAWSPPAAGGGSRLPELLRPERPGEPVREAWRVDTGDPAGIPRRRWAAGVAFAPNPNNPDPPGTTALAQRIGVTLPTCERAEPAPGVMA